MKKIYSFLFIVLLFFGCATNPFTGKTTMAFISNAQLFPMAFSQFNEFKSENTIVTGTEDSEMIIRAGLRIVDAADKLLVSQGFSNYFRDYEWEFLLVKDNSINAWVMPGGKIVFYTGILPITQNEDGLAVVMGHEIAHAILNHGQQRMSAGLLQQLGAVGLTIATANSSPEGQALVMAAFGVGTTLGGTLPFSRKHEREADLWGLKLMAIAGYNPEEGAAFWQRMIAAGAGATPEFLSTHPSPPNRVRDLRNNVPKARHYAAEFGVVHN
ncbi:MAG: M48 family metallopeptidase [Treponema sp.]|jgi:predicted Zn-dependent protease|nr:M48 family metallopeptidase [Treponema sp.]